MRTLTFSIVVVLVILGTSSTKQAKELNYDAGIAAYMRKHYETAMYEFEPRAMQDDLIAQYYVGRMYYLGQGVKKDEKKAIEWFEKLVMIVEKRRNESPRAEGFSSGYYLRNAQRIIDVYQQKQETRNQVVENYTDEDVSVLREMAKDGDAHAQYILGYLHGHAKGKVKHYTEAAKWYEMAASQGHYFAQNNLAGMYKGGNPGVGGKKNLKKAMRLFFEAAQQGNIASQYNLGDLFKTGIPEIPMSPNNKEAYYWFYLAAESKRLPDHLQNNALKNLDELKDKLVSEQLNEVQSRAKEWKRKRPKTSSGSGFYITPQHILTNEHVIREADEVFVSFWPAKVVERDTIHDLALLKVDSNENRSAVAKFRSSPVELAEDIGVYGYPLPKTLSYDGNFTKGSVSALVGLGLNELLSEHLQSVRWPNALFQFTAPIQGGNSGGPVFDKAGNVVGVAVMQRRPYLAQNVNFAINFNAIKAFLQEEGIIDQVKVDSTSVNAIEWTDIAKQAQEFTVPVLSFKNK